MKIVFFEDFVAKVSSKFFESRGYFCVLFGFESKFLLGFDGHLMILENEPQSEQPTEGNKPEA